MLQRRTDENTVRDMMSTSVEMWTRSSCDRGTSRRSRCKTFGRANGFYSDVVLMDSWYTSPYNRIKQDGPRVKQDGSVPRRRRCSDRSFHFKNGTLITMYHRHGTTGCTPRAGRALVKRSKQWWTPSVVAK